MAGENSIWVYHIKFELNSSDNFGTVTSGQLIKANGWFLKYFFNAKLKVSVCYLVTISCCYNLHFSMVLLTYYGKKELQCPLLPICYMCVLIHFFVALHIS